MPARYLDNRDELTEKNYSTAHHPLLLLPAWKEYEKAFVLLKEQVSEHSLG